MAVSGSAPQPLLADCCAIACRAVVRESDPSIALTRKNALFAGHGEGSRAWGRIASLLAKVKINGVAPFACFKAAHDAIAAGHPASRLAAPPLELPAVKLNARCPPGAAYVKTFAR
ncbi:hypothetical protein ETW24_13185 [Leisingera sp. NJS204]|nr:hypothetical protein ETW24_13185 [Leisingera sp. NJS204]